MSMLPSTKSNDLSASGISGWWTSFCLLGAVTFLFGPTIYSDHNLLFRDVAHFYAPLWEWARGEWGAGRIPLWNPFQNLGVAHLAENTSSVFYPGKLLFALPGSFRTLFHLFLAGHVVLAGFTTYRLLRGWGRSTTAGGIAAVSYAMSGGILFQYCNPPFLIGAAWLPAAIGAASTLLKQRSFANASRVAAILALMVLGGDVQTVYHVGLMMVLMTIMLWIEARKAPVVPAGIRTAPQRRGLFHGLRWIGIAAVLGVSLAAVQILPTAQHTAESSRATYAAPRSLDEVVLEAAKGNPISTTALLAKTKPADDPHHQRVFEFSVGPWRWAELIWPNVSGRWFPINARWIETLPAEGRVWTPSLYLGVLPFWLALGAIRYRRQLPIEGRWLVWCTLLSVLGSMGAYGAGWLYVDWITYRDGVATASPIGQNFGNLYWLMTVVLPWYVKFRYPAKLWTIATFGLSVLAGMEWDRRQAIGGGRSRRLLFLGFVSALGVAATVLFQTQMQQAWIRAAISDSIFGPLDVAMAWADVLLAFSRSALLCLITAALFMSQKHRPSSWGARLVIFLVTIDVVFAHRWMLPSAPTTVLGSPPVLADDSEDKLKKAPPVRIYRSQAKDWRPEDWKTTTSPERMAALVRWDRATLYPQHHLSTGQSVLDASTTIPNRDWQALLEVSREMGPSRNDGVEEVASSVLAALDVEHHVAKSTNEKDGFAATQLSGAVGRVWAVDDVSSSLPLVAPTRAQLLDRTREIWFPKSHVIDVTKSASIESEVPFTLDDHDGVDDDKRLEAVCHVTHYAPNHVVVEASVSKPALLVLNEQFHPDWQTSLSVDGSPLRRVPLLKTNRVMRGVHLEKAGNYEIHYTFRSRAFEVGAAVSSGAWVILLLGWLTRGVMKRTGHKKERNRS